MIKVKSFRTGKAFYISAENLAVVAGAKCAGKPAGTCVGSLDGQHMCVVESPKAVALARCASLENPTAIIEAKQFEGN